MTETNLIQKLKTFKQIKPRKDWVVFAKKQILGEEPKLGWASVLEIFPRILFQPKFVFANFIIVGILIGSFISAQNSLPGEPLYLLKKISERGQALFVSEVEKPRAQLELANKRLEELTKIAETNQVKKLAPALEEYQASISQAAENLKEVKGADIKEIAKVTKKLEESKKRVEALGVVIEETEELNNALTSLAEREIQELEKQILTENQEKLLEEAKEDYEAGNFASALEKILLLGYPQK